MTREEAEMEIHKRHCTENKFCHDDCMCSENACPYAIAISALKHLRDEENSTEEDCASCQYYERTADQYPCSHCRNCYPSKFKAKLGSRENENQGG